MLKANIGKRIRKQRMYMGGISQRTIENRGGWSRNSPVLRQIYQNTLADKERAETDKINAYFSQFEAKK